MRNEYINFIPFFHADKDKPTLFEIRERISMDTIIVGVVPSALILITVAVIGIIGCVWHKQQMHNQSDTMNILKLLQSKMATDNTIESRKQLISVMKEAFPQLDQNKKALSKGASGQSFRIEGDGADMPDFGRDIELDVKESASTNKEQPSDVSTTYDITVTSNDEISDLLACFVCESVRATIQQNHDQHLAAKVVKDVAEIVGQKQMMETI